MKKLKLKALAVALLACIGIFSPSVRAEGEVTDNSGWTLYSVDEADFVLDDTSVAITLPEGDLHADYAVFADGEPVSPAEDDGRYYVETGMTVVVTVTPHEGWSLRGPAPIVFENIEDNQVVAPVPTVFGDTIGAQDFTLVRNEDGTLGLTVDGALTNGEEWLVVALDKALENAEAAGGRTCGELFWGMATNLPGRKIGVEGSALSETALAALAAGGATVARSSDGSSFDLPGGADFALVTKCYASTAGLTNSIVCIGAARGLEDNLKPGDETHNQAQLPEIRNLALEQHHPWNGKIDVSFDLVPPTAPNAHVYSANITFTLTTGGVSRVFTPVGVVIELTRPDGHYVITLDGTDIFGPEVKRGRVDAVLSLADQTAPGPVTMGYRASGRFDNRANIVLYPTMTDDISYREEWRGAANDAGLVTYFVPGGYPSPKVMGGTDGARGWLTWDPLATGDLKDGVYDFTHVGLTDQPKYTLVGFEAYVALTNAFPAPSAVEPIITPDEELKGFSVVLGTNYENGVTLPDNLGPVTIDLNGWRIAGADGSAGTDATAGGDGGAAVTIVPEAHAGLGPTVVTFGNFMPWPAEFAVIDLDRLGETNCTTFEVRRSAAEVAAAYNNDEFKTGKLVLRKVPANLEGYLADPGSATNGMAYPVTRRIPVSNAYYVAVFEVTEAQYDRVMGVASPSSLTIPKNHITYNMIRGGADAPDVNPEDPNAEGSFLGRLTAKALDANGVACLVANLPTERQWEIAARGGSGAEYGAWLDADGAEADGTAATLNAFAWNAGSDYSAEGNYPAPNVPYVQPVGRLACNRWSLWDMLGNVEEWCLDRVSFATTNEWVRRGGSFEQNAVLLRPSFAQYYAAGDGNNFAGIRVVCELAGADANARPRSGEKSGVIGGNGGAGNRPGDAPAEAVAMAAGVREGVEVKDPDGVIAQAEDGELLKNPAQFALEGVFETNAVVRPLWDDDTRNVTGHVVTLVADMTMAGGPLELPRDLGPVVLDLDGHALRGTNGVDGTTAAAATDGGSAILITAATTNCTLGATAIVVIDGSDVASEPPAAVYGGNGGNGSPAGRGAPAITNVAEAAGVTWRGDPSALIVDGLDGYVLIDFPTVVTNFTYDTHEKRPVAETDVVEGLVLSNDVAKAEAGDYDVWVAVSNGYAWADGTCAPSNFAWSVVKRPEWAILEEVFDGVASLEAIYDAAGGYAGTKVNVTNDVDDAAFELPGNLGPVVIDLRGKAIRGANGGDGTEWEPGTNGTSAILFVADAEEVTEAGATELFVTNGVTGAEGCAIYGGDGGDGNPPGLGAPGIGYAEGVDTNAVTWTAAPETLVVDGEDGEFFKNDIMRALEAIFDEEGDAVVPVYEDGRLVGHRVTLGEGRGDAPVELPDDLWNVILDLNGQTIRGTNGVAGTSATAATAGCSAVTVVATTNEPPLGAATQLKVVDGTPAQEGRLVGGNGADGNAPSRGSKAISAAEGANESVAWTVDPETLAVNGTNGVLTLPPELPLKYVGQADEDTAVFAVTGTEEQVAAAIPFRLPDNAGNLVIDLAGHDLVATNGCDGGAEAPGGDGGNALVIFDNGENEGLGPTVMTLIDTTASSADRTLVRGGDGGHGAGGGDGGAAILVESERDGVTVNVGDFIEVIGGNGGTGYGLDGDPAGGLGAEGVDPTAHLGEVSVTSIVTRGDDGEGGKLVWAKARAADGFAGEVPFGVTLMDDGWLYFWGATADVAAEFDFDALGAEALADGAIYFCRSNQRVGRIAVSPGSGAWSFLPAEGANGVLIPSGADESMFDVRLAAGEKATWRGFKFRTTPLTAGPLGAPAAALPHEGAAIRVVGGALEVADCSFTGLKADELGGAIFAAVLDADSVITNCSFESCSVALDNGYGGAVYASARKGSGAALAVEDVSFSQNVAVYGGAVATVPTDIEGEREPVRLVFAGCGFYQNDAAEEGGAVFAMGEVTVVGTNDWAYATEFVGNTASVFGGAIAISGVVGKFLDVENLLVVSNGTYFADNAVDNVRGYGSFDGSYALGGAIAVLADNAVACVTRATFTNNVAYSRNDMAQGGAIFVDYNAAGAVVHKTAFDCNKVLSDNDAAYGGALSSYAETLVDTCTFDGDVANGYPGYSFGGAVDLETSAAVLANSTFRRSNVDAVSGYGEELCVSNCVVVGNGTAGSIGDVDVSFDMTFEECGRVEICHTAYGSIATFGGAAPVETHNLANRTTAIYAGETLDLSRTGFNPVAALGVRQPGVTDFRDVAYGSLPAGWSMGAFECPAEGLFAEVRGDRRYDGTTTADGITNYVWTLVGTNGEAVAWSDFDVTNDISVTDWEFGAPDAGAYSSDYEAPTNIAAAFAGRTDEIQHYLDSGVISIIAYGDILRRPVQFRSGSAQKTYDTLPLVCHEAEDCSAETLAGDEPNGLVEGETVDYGWTGSRTEVGVSSNDFSVAFAGEGGAATAKRSNYDVRELLEGELEILPLDVSQLDIQYPDEFVYGGTNVCPYVEVSITNALGQVITNLVIEIDYNVTYTNNVNAYDEPLIIIEPSSNFTGVATNTFDILPREVTFASATDVKVYDGTALTNHTVTYTRQDDAENLSRGILTNEEAYLSFEVTGSQTEVGMSTNWFTVGWGTNETDATKWIDARNYDVTVEYGTLTVTLRGVGGLVIEVDPEEYEWTGYPIVPDSSDVTVYDTDEFGRRTRTLVEGVDYELSYSNNVETTDRAVVVVTPKGNYGPGTASTNFWITAYFVDYYVDGAKKGPTEKYGALSGSNALARIEVPAGYCLDWQHSTTNGEVRRFVTETAEADHNLLRLVVRYAKDDNGDAVPDQYQKRMLLKVVNGWWNVGDNGYDKTVWVTLYKPAGSGVWDADGTGCIGDEIDATDLAGKVPFNGFIANGAWTYDPATAAVTWDTVPFFLYAYAAGTGPGGGRGGRGGRTDGEGSFTMPLFSPLLTISSYDRGEGETALGAVYEVKDAVEGKTLGSAPLFTTRVTVETTRSLGGEKWVDSARVITDGEGVATVNETELPNAKYYRLRLGN